MINNTINKTIGMLQGLTEKIINLKQKTDQNSLLSQEYEELNNKIDILSAIFNTTIQPPNNENIQTHQYIFNISNAKISEVNGNYWDVSDQYAIFYDENGNVVDSFENASYAFDGIYTNGICFVAFNLMQTQITKNTPLTTEKLYEIAGCYWYEIPELQNFSDFTLTKL